VLFKGLGPTLFNIFVNDLDKSLQYCRILKYADDTRIFLCANKSPNDLSSLQLHVQNDINNIVRWSRGSGLKLNIDKCFSVSFGRHNIPREYFIDNCPIPHLSQFSDLGLIVRSPFSFKSHIEKIVSRAFSKLGLINKIFKHKCRRSIVVLFKSFIRPSLEYSSIIWNPHTQTSIDSIERVQRRMCRLIPEIRDLSYKQQLKELNILSLRARRLRFQLITMFKIQKGLLNIDLKDFFDIPDFRRTRGHSYHLIPKFSSHNYRLHFFTVNVITYWNQLTNDDIEVPSVSTFKRRLSLFFNRSDIW